MEFDKLDEVTHCEFEDISGQKVKKEQVRWCEDGKVKLGYRCK